jgi:hypothetical protein
LFFQPVEAFAERRNGIPYAWCSCSYHPAPRRRARRGLRTSGRDLGDADREGTWHAEGRGGDERAQADARRVASQPGERDPGIGRARTSVAVAHVEEVIAAEECVEAEILGSTATASSWS